MTGCARPALIVHLAFHCIATVSGCADDSATDAGGNGNGGSGGDDASGGGGDATVGAGGAGGGSGGTGEGGTGGAVAICTPGATEPCYSGPPGTESIGACASGLRACRDDGSAYGDCEGETIPAVETCLEPTDEDCDGETNEGGVGCVCSPGEIAACYSGAVETFGVGVCSAGLEICNEDGTEAGACVGEVLPRQEDCASVSDEDCDGSAPACTGAHVFSRRHGDATNQFVGAIATDAAGNIVLVGPFQGTVDFGGGGLMSAGAEDIYLAKLDPSGGHVFSKRFGDTTAQGARGVATDPAGNILFTGFVTGTTSFGGAPMSAGPGGDVYVAKLDPTGAHLWSRVYAGTSGDRGRAIAVSPSGDIALTGIFTLDIQFGGATLQTGGAEDVFVAKLDANGTHLWSKNYGNSSSQRGHGIAFDGDHVLIVGEHFGAIDFGNGPLTSAGSTDLFVAKLGPSGAPLWSRGLGDSDAQSALAVAVDAGGNIFVTGIMRGTVDFGGGPLTSTSDSVFLVKLDASGGHVWSRRFGQNSAGLALATDFGGNVLLAGSFQGSIDFGGGGLTSTGTSAAFVAKFDGAGNHVWSKRFGGALANNTSAVATGPGGEVIAGGDFTGTSDFGGGGLLSSGGSDGFVVKFAP